VKKKLLACSLVGLAIFAAACAELPASGGSEGPKFVFFVEGKRLFETTKEALARWSEQGNFRYEVFLADRPVPRWNQKHLFAPGTVYLYEGSFEGDETYQGFCVRKGEYDGASIAIVSSHASHVPVVMHEIGHALNLRHVDDPTSVMFPDVAVYHPSASDFARLNEALKP